ncbi:substrate-binding domain-containing protein [Teredinibacter haidensis]|uniref:substrate-binding domain-containing protein n=1 Tax=Teredinibacter haidensis TaxID=2731755 RepID=UPI0009F83CFC|nr:substrate-binding domain-containing protein [Teredinibacter haidensis]
MTSNSSPRLGVFSPYMQGFYFGEMIGQLQQICRVKNYNFSLICTGGFGEYTSTAHINHLDFIIILRNAIHVDLAKQLIGSGKLVISVSYEYFPLPIPVVSCDNEFGMQLAFDYLLEKGHKHFTYAGDLSIFDLRKRYEAFCDLHEEHDLDLSETHLISLKDTIFKGGFEAAKSFIASGSNSTAIICGAGLTAAGLSLQLKYLDPEIREKITIVGFDNTSITPVCSPDVHTVDQNLHLLAAKAVEILESQIIGEQVSQMNTITPKFIPAETVTAEGADMYLATSVELTELHNANYMKAIISNFYVWPKKMAQEGLETFMTLAPLFPGYIKMAAIARVAFGKNGTEYTKISKVILPDKVITTDIKDSSSLCPANKFPIPLDDMHLENYSNTILLPVARRGSGFDILMVLGTHEHTDSPNSLSALCGYLSVFADLNHLEKIKESHNFKTVISDESIPNTAGTILWMINRNETIWDNNALNILGFTSDLDQNVYKNMYITDRIHEEDERTVRDMLINARSESVEFVARLKMKDRNYSEYRFTCEYENETNTVVCTISPWDASA